MTDGKIRLSPTDLSHFLDCKHIITLDMARLNGEEIPVQETDEFAKIITQNGINHEKKYCPTSKLILRTLSRSGKT